ncbi:hypothetical protein [Spirillospora sp. NPDC047279]|uniref:hypothetical protein n=1 Tax=Spirillospora sp. NPDC047279 TaxID=3155478 RepID=UPI0033EA7810
MPAPRDPSGGRLGWGWNGVSWGTSSDEFTKRFPQASQQNGDWWVTGLGPETFCGVTMDAQYAFNDNDEFAMVVFYPEIGDRARLPGAVSGELGAPGSTATVWRVGKVEVSVKPGGGTATLRHTVYADR